MKYYRLMRYADNAVGADICYCTEEELADVTADFKPNLNSEEVSFDEYQQEQNLKEKRGLHLFTGYWNPC